MTQPPQPFEITIGSVSRSLRTVPVGQVGYVPLVEFIGDSELTKAAARALLPLIPEGTQALLSVVTNALPLVHELSALSGLPYEVARKKRRSYMQRPLIQEVPGLTLGVSETLWLDSFHAQRLRDKQIAIVQDVIATGAVASALARLAERAGGTVNGYLAAFKQGETGLPLRFLQALPKRV